MKLALFALLSLRTLFGQTASPPPDATPPVDAPKVDHLRFDISAIDKSTNPCEDFYQYACGTWISNNPIPADQARWGRFTELAERNREVLHEILDESSRPDPSRDTITRKVGDYYAACINVAGIDAKGLAPLQPELDRIRDLKDKGQLASAIAHMHRTGISALFEFGSGQDFKNSNEVIAQYDQDCLGLPDRDYYLSTDQRSADIRQKYLTHVQRMFELAGERAEQTKNDARTVMRIETELAKGSLDRVSRRDPAKIYHRMKREELNALSPSFRWKQYFTDSGAPKFQDINVAWPNFVKAMNAAIDAVSLEDWKTYLRWHMLHSKAALLPTPFVEENFSFYGEVLTGAKQMRPRWKRCVDFTDNQLGEALGQKFVERTFGAEAKQRTLDMVHASEKALSEIMGQATWMTPGTKEQAQIKLVAITNKIGYPEKWRDYSSVAIKRDDALGNGIRADQFEFQRQLNKIGMPPDRGESSMTPPTVNAYYDPLMNNINFPAGILQPPFYDKQIDAPVNFGGIGTVVGHELTHGFDDQGRRFDAQGNLRDWWTPADAKAFEERAACIAEQYSNFTPLPSVHLNGKLTLGENVADNGGLRVALMALYNTIGTQNQTSIDGFTLEQRFFLSFGQIWCESQREEILRLRVLTDPHSPGRYRVIGVLQNMPEFQKAFSCKPGQAMVREKTCRVW